MESVIRRRTRPLTPEMQLFMRQLTHYLQHIAYGLVERLRNLSDSNANRVRNEAAYEKQMVETLAACNELCLLTYHKPVQTYETGETAIAE